jgi:hypothetical protein
MAGIPLGNRCSIRPGKQDEDVDHARKSLLGDFIGLHSPA